MTVDLRTRYLGLELAHPVVASASPLGGRLDTLLRVEEAGAAAIVLPSLFEEQVEDEALALHAALEEGADAFGEALSYLPELDAPTAAERYLEHVAAATSRLGIPLIGSLNGVSSGGWLRYARMIEEAGADALELSIYRVEADLDASAAAIEAEVVELVAAVRAAVRIPLAVKVAPYYTAFASLARRLADAGADGLVLFNRFVQPDVDLETLSLVPEVRLSSSAELLLPLRWIGLLRDRVGASLAASGGVHRAEDALKLLLAGADAVMTTSALLQGGPGRIGGIVDGVRRWLEEREYASVEQMKGSMSQARSDDPGAFERASYVRALSSYRVTP